MPKRGKQYKNIAKDCDTKKKYSLDEAVNLALESSYSKFDESIDLAVRLGIDPKKSDQMVRGAIILPNGIGKEVKVLVFAKGEKETEAKEAGANYVGSDDLVEKIKAGWLDFDKTVATPDLMGAVGKIAKLLGPRGLMPNAKLGTVTFDVGKMVNELKSGRIEYRAEKAGIIHSSVGKKSFGKDKIIENIDTLINSLIKAKPTSSKGKYIRGISVSTTMGLAFKIDVQSYR